MIKPIRFVKDISDSIRKMKKYVQMYENKKLPTENFKALINAQSNILNGCYKAEDLRYKQEVELKLLELEERIKKEEQWML